MSVIAGDPLTARLRPATERRTWVRAFLVLLVAVAGPAAPAATSTPQTPAEFLGHPVGADRLLADYHRIVRYLDDLDDVSDRLQVLRLGETTLGNEFVVAAISSAENLANAERYREIAARLADPRGLTAEEQAGLIAEGKVIVLVTLNIHSTEIGASQMAMELAWQLATGADEEAQAWLEDVILLMVPSLNPDGQLMVTEWYRDWVGTEFEGGPMPRLYHHYAGHDNNRDWFMLNLAETRLLNRLLYQDWHPHVFVDEHQMGMTGPRLFLPPFKDPPGENVHPLIWRLIDRIGTAMALREQEAGHSGVVQSAQFDAYWLGGTRNTGWYKNVVGLLTELASTRIASPIYVDPGELRGGIKGLPEYRSQANFPDPWPGGWWRLRDIIDYELVLTRSLLETTSRYREDFLGMQVTMAREATARGKADGPAAWVVPADQHDPNAAADMIRLLREHGVEVHRTSGAIEQEGRALPAGAWVIRADQPYRQFVKEILEPQRYPEVRSSVNGPVYLPYDVNTWSLPFLFGVEVETFEEPLQAPLEKVDVVRSPPTRVEGSGPVALMHPAGNAPSAAINRLLTEGARVSLARAPFAASGRDWPAGTAIVQEFGDLLDGVSTDLHVSFQRLTTAPDVESMGLQEPRLGLYQGFAPSMDEGWTRYVLDGHGFRYESVNNETIAAGDLIHHFDVLLFASQSKSTIVDAKSSSSRYRLEFPPEFRGGIGADGVKALQQFVEAGGTLIALDASAELPITEMNLPVRRPLAKLGRDKFYCPGSMLRVDIDNGHPLGFGMPERGALLFTRSQPFQTTIPGAESTRTVVASFPDEPLLLSGWISGEKLLHRKAALVEVGKGEGRIVLFGFRPQFRAQSRATFKLLFNAIHLGASNLSPTGD